jgi:hypothetical protein
VAQEFLIVARTRDKGVKNMLAIIATVLIVLWLLGFLAFHVSSGFIHILLVIGIVMLLLHFVRSRASTVWKTCPPAGMSAVGEFARWGPKGDLVNAESLHFYLVLFNSEDALARVKHMSEQAKSAVAEQNWELVLEMPLPSSASTPHERSQGFRRFAGPFGSSGQLAQ